MVVWVAEELKAAIVYPLFIREVAVLEQETTAIAPIAIIRCERDPQPLQGDLTAYPA